MRENTFGAYLLQVIRLHDLSQKEAAAMLNLSPQTLSNYILNKRIPDMKTLAHILNVFHMDANKVLQITDADVVLSLSQDEAALVSAYRQLDEQHRDYALKMIQSIPK